jgi:hypothetical protein
MLLVIILLATSICLNTAEIVILIVFLLLEAYIKFKIIVILLLIVLSPLICLFLIFYVCCCRPRDGRTMKLDIQVRSAEHGDIIKSGGECSICLSDIKINEKIYQLKCSEKHIFHQGCI